MNQYLVNQRVGFEPEIRKVDGRNEMYDHRFDYVVNFMADDDTSRNIITAIRALTEIDVTTTLFQALNADVYITPYRIYVANKQIMRYLVNLNILSDIKINIPDAIIRVPVTFGNQLSLVV